MKIYVLLCEFLFLIISNLESHSVFWIERTYFNNVISVYYNLI